MRWRAGVVAVLVIGAFASYCATVARAIRGYDAGAFNE